MAFLSVSSVLSLTLCGVLELDAVLGQAVPRGGVQGTGSPGNSCPSPTPQDGRVSCRRLMADGLQAVEVGVPGNRVEAAGFFSATGLCVFCLRFPRAAPQALLPSCGAGGLLDAQEVRLPAPCPLLHGQRRACGTGGRSWGRAPCPAEGRKSSLGWAVCDA